MKSQDAYKLLFCDYPDVVTVEQMCEMLGGISTKTAYRLLKAGTIKSFVDRPPLSNPKAQHFRVFGIDRKI